MTCFELLKVSRVKVTKGDQLNISVNVIPVLTFIHTHIIYMRLLCVHVGECECECVCVCVCVCVCECK